MSQDETGRDGLIGAILHFLCVQDLLTQEDIRVALEQEIDDAGPAALLDLRASLAADNGWSYYPPDPLARRIHQLLADRFLGTDSILAGAEHLARLDGEPVAIFANHLSYADANAIDILLERFGSDTLASRLTAIAGPKVFTDRQRRFSSLCFGTVKAPQSAGVSSEEAVLNVRDVARAARRAIDTALERLRAGDALLLFGEGTRSRTGEMQPILPGVARYLDVPGTWVVPAGLTGSEALFPIGEATIHPARIVIRFGRPFRADALVAAAGRDRRVIVDAIGLAVAALLPPEYRGVYGDPVGFAASRDALERSSVTRPKGRRAERPNG
jgi:1-acyl-sn-glycerol-3-phosphate acyltransferase